MVQAMPWPFSGSRRVLPQDPERAMVCLACRYNLLRSPAYTNWLPSPWASTQQSRAGQAYRSAWTQSTIWHGIRAKLQAILGIL